MVCNRNDAVRHFYAHTTYFYRLLLASISNNRKANFRHFTVYAVCFFQNARNPMLQMRCSMAQESLENTIISLVTTDMKGVPI